MPRIPRHLHKILPPDSAEIEAAREKDHQKTRAEGDRKAIGSTVKEPVVGSEEDQRLLEVVATNWTTGKNSVQTTHCVSAIRNCLLQGMKQVTIAHYVTHHAMPLKDQAVEFARIKDCVYRVNKSLKKSGEGAASKGVLYHRNGDVLSRGDSSQKSVEAAMASLSISAKMKDAGDTTQSQGNSKLIATDQVKKEQHWMVMWRNARVELKKLREELKGETDEDVMDELKNDIGCLKKKRDEWAVLLGMKE